MSFYSSATLTYSYPTFLSFFFAFSFFETSNKNPKTVWKTPKKCGYLPSIPQDNAINPTAAALLKNKIYGNFIKLKGCLLKNPLTNKDMNKKPNALGAIKYELSKIRLVVSIWINVPIQTRNQIAHLSLSIVRFPFDVYSFI